MESKEKSNNLVNIIIAQAICVALVLCSILAVKYFFKKEYKEIKGFYLSEVATNTDIQEVLK